MKLTGYVGPASPDSASPADLVVVGPVDPITAQHHRAWLNQRKYKRIVSGMAQDIDSTWRLTLICGHVRHIASPAKPRNTGATCIDCALNDLAKHNGGRSIVSSVEQFIKGLWS